MHENWRRCRVAGMAQGDDRMAESDQQLQRTEPEVWADIRRTARPAGISQARPTVAANTAFVEGAPGARQVNPIAIVDTEDGDGDLTAIYWFFRSRVGE